jgi:hypothetical protein
LRAISGSTVTYETRRTSAANTATKLATMVTPSDQNSMDTADHEDELMGIVEETVTAIPGATNNNRIGSEMKEFLICFQIPVRRGQSIDDHLRLHPQFLHILTTAFPAPELHVLNRHNRRATKFDDLKWSEKQYYDDQFNHHVDISAHQTVIEHRLQSTYALSDLLSSPPIATFLQSTRTSLITPEVSHPPPSATTILADETPPIRQSVATIHAKEREKMVFSSSLDAAKNSINSINKKAVDSEQDDQSTATVPRGRTHEIDDDELVEIYIRYEITKTKKQDDRSPHLCHAAVLHNMYSSFSEDDLQIINNRNQCIKLPNYKKWVDETYYKKHFDLHLNPGKGGRPDRYYVVHRIRTTIPLSHIRNERKTFQALQENNVFLRRHYFQEDEWNTVNLGFMLFLDPSKYLRDEAQQKVLNLAIEGANGTPLGDGAKFQLVAGTPFRYVRGKRLATKAFTVVCQRQYAGAVDTLLKTTYHDTCHYVKFRLRHKNGPAFSQAILAQNQYLSSLRTIPLVGISRPMMQELQHDIREIIGVADVVRSTKTDINGRWNILTDEDNFFPTLKSIRKNLQGWLDLRFDGIYDRPSDFPEVTITAKVANDGDDSSVGECSYLSTSALSYSSLTTSGSYDFTPDDTVTQPNLPHSYAAAVTSRSKPTPTPHLVAGAKSSSVSAMSSPATVPLDLQHKFREMEAKLSRYQGIEAKLDRLEQMLSTLMGASTSSTTPSLPPPAELHTQPSDDGLDLAQKLDKHFPPIISKLTPPPAPIPAPRQHFTRQMVSSSPVRKAMNRYLHAPLSDSPPVRKEKPIAEPPIIPRTSQLSPSASATLDNRGHELFLPNGDGTFFSVGHSPTKPPPEHSRTGSPALNSGQLALAWRKVEKWGKRTAENFKTAAPKRSDVRDTPTKRKPSPKGIGLMAAKPAESKITTFYNPYKADQPTLLRNPPHPPHPRSDPVIDNGCGNQPMEILSQPPSPSRSLPAAEAKHDH